MDGMAASGMTTPRSCLQIYPLRYLAGQREHAAHRHREDELDDGGLELEEDRVVQEERQAAGDGEQHGVGRDEGVGLFILDEGVGELDDADSDADDEADLSRRRGRRRRRI